VNLSSCQTLLWSKQAYGVHQWCMCYLFFMCDDVSCAWLLAVATQGLCAPTSAKLLTPDVYLIQLHVLEALNISS